MSARDAGTIPQSACSCQPPLHKGAKGLAQPKAFPSEGKAARLAEPDEVDTQKSGTLFADQRGMRQIA